MVLSKLRYIYRPYFSFQKTNVPESKHTFLSDHNQHQPQHPPHFRPRPSWPPGAMKLPAIKAPQPMSKIFTAVSPSLFPFCLPIFPTDSNDNWNHATINNSSQPENNCCRPIPAREFAIRTSSNSAIRKCGRGGVVNIFGVGV